MIQFHLVKSSNKSIILLHTMFSVFVYGNNFEDKAFLVAIHNNYLNDLSILWFACRSYDKVCFSQLRFG